jgi:hypothetical protein
LESGGVPVGIARRHQLRILDQAVLVDGDEQRDRLGLGLRRADDGRRGGDGTRKDDGLREGSLREARRYDEGRAACEALKKTGH